MQTSFRSRQASIKSVTPLSVLMLTSPRFVTYSANARLFPARRSSNALRATASAEGSAIGDFELGGFPP